jgi:hypothetical protein
VDDDVPVLLLLDLRDLACELPVEHRRVVPLRVLERGRNDVLRHRVELVGELAIPGRPGCREAFVGPPTQKERLRGHRLVELELVAFLAPLDLEGPAAVLVVLPAAGGFHDAVQRHELGYDDASHE